jgi:hypothetical protein
MPHKFQLNGLQRLGNMKTVIKINSTLEPKLEELVDELVAKKRSKNPFPLKETIGISFGLVGFITGLWQWTEKSYEVEKARARITLFKVYEELQKIEMTSSKNDLAQFKQDVNRLQSQIEQNQTELENSKELNKKAAGALATSLVTMNKVQASLVETKQREDNIKTNLQQLKADEDELLTKQEKNEEKVRLQKDKLKQLKVKLGAVLIYASEEGELSNYAILKLLSVKVISQLRGCTFCINKKNVSVFVDYPKQYNEKLSKYFDDVNHKRIQKIRYVNLRSQYANKPPSSINFKNEVLNQLFKDPNGIRYLSSYIGNDVPTALTAQVELSASRKTPDNESKYSAEYEDGGCFEIYYSKERKEQTVFPRCRT